ncbi:MAG: HEAT repeat domain-containing protein [Spirochaetes bacterium]|nr:HEAT repeat domain-containing protein [Spirochaetota bacterium]
MPVFVHLSSEKNIKKIQRSGIKPAKTYYNITGIFCMPVEKNYFISHQWLRELKRRGARTVMGIYFKIASDETVWIHHYQEEPVSMKAGEAIKKIKQDSDASGYQVIIPRKVLKKEIVKIKYISQVTGWRYYPGSHGRKKSCLCPACIPRGSINAQKTRKNRYNKLIKEIKNTDKEKTIISLLQDVSDIITWSSGNIKNIHDLAFLMDHPSVKVIRNLISTLLSYKNDQAIPFLQKMLEHKNKKIKQDSAKGIIQLQGAKGLKLLGKYKNDRSIYRIIRTSYKMLTE